MQYANFIASKLELLALLGSLCKCMILYFENLNFVYIGPLHRFGAARPRCCVLRIILELKVPHRTDRRMLVQLLSKTILVHASYVVSPAIGISREKLPHSWCRLPTTLCHVVSVVGQSS